MDKDILKYWDKNNHKIKEWLKNIDDTYLHYGELLKKTIELIIDDYGYGLPDHSLLTEIDNGDYQGTIIFIIGGYGYQPSVQDHWHTNTYYGSCSGCDTLQSILCDYAHDGEGFSDGQINDLWTLCLHMIQKMKRLEDAN